MRSCARPPAPTSSTPSFGSIVPTPFTVLRCVACAAVLAAPVLAAPALAQAPDGAKVKKPAELFRSETPFAVTLTTNFDRLKRDRVDKAPWRPATLSYAGDSARPVTVPIRARTRGIWRLRKCDLPPLRLDFARENARRTIFRGLDRPKLVNYCRNTDAYEQYILQELQLYRVYNLLTPASHRVRLARVTYVDSADAKVEAVRYGIFLEEPNALAGRLDGRIIETKGATADDLHPSFTALVGVFAYMIGNTDLSINGLHNAELLALPDGTVAPVLYDFDFSGAVNARYATADTSLRIKRVRDRQFRGLCVPPGEFARVFALFNERKAAIYQLYHDDIGALLAPRIVDETLKYYDEFYKTINDPRAAQRSVLDDCVGKPPA